MARDRDINGRERPVKPAPRPLERPPPLSREDRVRLLVVHALDDVKLRLCNRHALSTRRKPGAPRDREH